MPQQTEVTECPTCHNVETRPVCPLCQKVVARSDPYAQITGNSDATNPPNQRVFTTVHTTCLAQPGVTVAAAMPDLIPPAADV
jgi:hypothetical protein